MSPLPEYFPNEGVEALTILTKGTGGGRSAIARIEILEDRDREMRLAYAEYRSQTRDTLRSLENELDNRMKTFQIEMSEELKDLRKVSAELGDERHKEMKRYMQAIIGALFVALGTVLWKFITK
jgi:hypothetical protein